MRALELTFSVCYALIFQYEGMFVLYVQSEMKKERDRQTETDCTFEGHWVFVQCL